MISFPSLSFLSPEHRDLALGKWWLASACSSWGRTECIDKRLPVLTVGVVSVKRWRVCALCLQHHTHSRTHEEPYSKCLSVHLSCWMCLLSQTSITASSESLSGLQQVTESFVLPLFFFFFFFLRKWEPSFHHNAFYLSLWRVVCLLLNLLEGILRHLVHWKVNTVFWKGKVYSFTEITDFQDEILHWSAIST